VYSVFGFSQYDAFTFQALLLDASLNPSKNSSAIIRATISFDENQTNIYYQEEHEITTSEAGTIAFTIGNGIKVQGDFSNISWIDGVPYINIAYNLLDGNSWQDTGTIQFSSVPFCLESKFVFCQDGADGEEGPRGQSGPAGQLGPIGATGATGMTGPKGVPIITQLSEAPIDPQEGRVYLDDGSNTNDGNPGFMYYTGTAWINL